jgi:uncharacterized protein YdeI (YjbR/CyaY-like superfamily)
MKTPKTLYVTNRDEWRAWLEKHHSTEAEVWLVYYKKYSGRPRIPYDDAVEEALCFGWIDSNIQRIDDEKYAQKFTPRRVGSKWSELNKRRVAKLIEAGQMTEAGLSKVTVPLTQRAQPKSDPVLPSSVKRALKRNKQAWDNFTKLAQSYRRSYIRWITAAKTEETRDRRVKEAVALLEKNQKLGMK